LDIGRRPHLLLVAEFTELQWTIKSRLTEWAEVASFDPPGVGSEPLPEGTVISNDLIAERGLAELAARGWDRFFLAGDGWGNAAVARIARARRDAVQGIALGHASLSNRKDGERPPVSRQVWEALTQLLHQDTDAFLRHGIVQATHGSVDEELAQRMIERFPDPATLVAGWEALTIPEEPIEDALRQVGAPLLFAKHEGCLISTEEGFEDAAAAFPEAETIVVEEAPSVSERFAEAVRRFCAAHTKG
jgi:pimeloyl-ACP methyl ester carboxylesterase